MRASLLLFFVCLLGCGSDEEQDATMTPGQDCLASGCHTDFSVGGTVFVAENAPLDQGLEGVTVTLLDAARKTLTLTSNRTGNFYSREPVAWPADVTLTLGEREGFMALAPSGACSSGACHTSNRGLVYLP